MATLEIASPGITAPETSAPGLAAPGLAATRTSQPTYQVHLPVFEGPLDLLLQLIEREKLDISTVSLALVADQFVLHVRALEVVEPALLADFLVMAARLVWIKSRALLPQALPVEEEEEEDPAEALARQLREYRRFKQVALALREIDLEGLHCYRRVAPPPEMERRLVTGEVGPNELLAAALSAFTQFEKPIAIPKGVAVIPFTLTIRDKIQQIRDVTSRGQEITFRSLVQEARSRLEIVVTLLAVLELIKRQQIEVSQGVMFGEIHIAQLAGVEITDDEPDSSASEEQVPQPTQ